MPVAYVECGLIHLHRRNGKMNWLDLVFIGIVGVSAFVGLKIGLIRAGFTALGLVVGSIVGGQLSDDIGGRRPRSD